MLPMLRPLPALLLLAAACGAPDDEPLAADSLDQLEPVPVMATMDVAMLDRDGRNLGTLEVTDADSGLTFTGRLAGLAPGEHGIHVHGVGTCESPFESAGDHWNPTDREHGHLNPEGAHHGDMMNVTVGDDSVANVDARTVAGSLTGMDGLLDADGAALVVHATADDYTTDPDGNSGDRIACGVLRSNM